ncbi:MAG TPA: hypothetical protein VIK45_08520 [Candidatus Dormibacteraeota bacterium]|jgi:hypothetical protein
MATTVAQEAVMGAIAQVQFEIESSDREQRRFQADAAAVCVPIALTDALLSELEVLNLAERTHVPSSFQPSLLWLLDNCPVECPELMVHTSPVDLMDMLFDLQESLFELKGGESRRRLQLEDEYRAYRHGSSTRDRRASPGPPGSL